MWRFEAVFASTEPEINDVLDCLLSLYMGTVEACCRSIIVFEDKMSSDGTGGGGCRDGGIGDVF